MADDKLRELERRWRASDAVEDKEAWLRERVRCGELTPQMLEAAVYLGCPVSARVSPEGRVAKELHHLTALRIDAVQVRTGLALVRQALPLLDEDEFGFSAEDQVIVRALSAVEDWLLAPKGKTKATVRAAGKALYQDCMDSLDFRSDDALNVMVLIGLIQAIVAPSLWKLWEEYVLDRVLRKELKPFSMVVRVARSISRSGAGPDLSESDFLRAVCFETVPWVLGVRDPVRDRVEQR